MGLPVLRLVLGGSRDTGLFLKSFSVTEFLSKSAADRVQAEGAMSTKAETPNRF
jgi:hypothetical protein